jgi:hypothetical protein
MYCFLWLCALLLALFVLWILFHSWCIRSATKKHQRELYTAQTRLIEPANIFHGRWRGEDGVIVMFDADITGVWSTGDDRGNVQFTYTRVHDPITQGGVWNAVVRTTTDASVLPLNTAFECLSKNSGQLRIPLFVENEQGEPADLILTRDIR